MVSIARLHRIARWYAYKTAKVLSLRGQERAVSLAAVVLLHIFLLSIIAWGSPHIPARPEPRDIQAALFLGENRPSPRIDIPEISFPVVEPPEIVIESDQPGKSIAAASTAVVLPPRPDPEHPNDQPVASAPASTPVVVLRILVSPDGSVVDAKIAPPLTRDPSADDAALTWVKAHWHFIPAMLGAVPIQCWTTVSVRFVAAR